MQSTRPPQTQTVKDAFQDSIPALSKYMAKLAGTISRSETIVDSDGEDV
jgi:hypothetical protein